MSKSVREHSAETREEAVRLYESGETARKVSAMLCVPFSTVKHWILQRDRSKRGGSRVRVQMSWRRIIEAIGDDDVSVNVLGERIGLNYASTYDRLRQMVRDNVAVCVVKGGSGRPSVYRLAVPAERAIAIMTAEADGCQIFTVSELERAWPAQILVAHIGHNETRIG